MKRFHFSISRLSIIALAACISITFSSCSSDDESAGPDISPEEAVVNYASNEDCQMVMSVRFGDLIDKSGLTGDLLPAELKMMADSYLTQFLDSKETGLDLNQTAFILGDLKGLPNPPAFGGVILAISDAETFAAFIEGQSRTQPEEGEGFKFISLGENAVIAWNAGFAGVFSGTDFMGPGASKATEKVMKAMTEKGKGKTNAIAKFASKKADFGFYMDYEKFSKVMPANDASLAFLNSDYYKDLMKDAYLSGFINFEKGKVVAEYDFAGNSKLKELIKKMYGSGNSEYASLLGGENLIGFLTVKMNIDELLNSYEQSGFFDMPEVAAVLSEMKEKTGLSVRDVINKFSGEFSIALAGISIDETEVAAPDENSYEGYFEDRKKSKPVITFAIGIRDSLFSKIFDTIPTLTKKPNYYAMKDKGGICVKNNVLFFSTDILLVEDFALDGRLNTYSKNNAQQSIGKYPAYGYFDFDAFKTALMEISPEVNEVAETFDYAEMMIEKSGSMKAVLYFKDKNTNSLKAISKLILAAAKKTGMMMF